MWIPTAQEASSALFPRQDTSNQDTSNKDKDDGGNKGPDWRVFTVVSPLQQLRAPPTRAF